MLEMVLEAADPGPLRLTNDGAEDWHILSVWVAVDARGGAVSSVQERVLPGGYMGWQGEPLCVCALTGSEEVI